MNLQEILDFINYVSNKEQSGKTFSPNQFNTLLPIVSTELFKQKYKHFEDTQEITDDLSAFKVWMGKDGVMPLEIDSNGYALLPTDYFHYSSILYKQVTSNPDCSISIKNRPVDILTDAQWDSRLSCPITQPSLKYPIANFQNNFIRFAPKNIGFVDFVYLKEPIIPVYAYTIDSLTDAVVYDPINSVQLDWGDDSHIEICNLLLVKIGINLKEANLFQYATMKGKEE